MKEQNDLRRLTFEELKIAIWEMGVKAEADGVEITQAMRFEAIAQAQLAKIDASTGSPQVGSADLRLKIAVSIHTFVHSGYPNGLTKDADDFAGHFVALIQQAKDDERERILNYLQDLIELSEKVKEPVIKVKMMAILQFLKEQETTGEEPKEK